MRTIIIYVHDLRSSGVVINAAALARRLAITHDVILCAGRADGFFAEIDVAPARLEVLRTRHDLFPRLAAALPQRRLLRRSGAAAVISEGNVGHLTLYLAARWLATARIYTLSNEIERGDGRDLLRRFWARRIARDATRLRFVGKRLAENPLFARDVQSGKAIHIPNAIHIDKARASLGGAPPHPWLEPGQPPVILTIGRLNRQKNLEGLIRAMMHVRPDARLIILGGGPPAYRAHLGSLAAA